MIPGIVGRHTVTQELVHVDPDTPTIAQPIGSTSGDWMLTMSEEFNAAAIIEESPKLAWVRFRPDGTIWRTHYPIWMLTSGDFSGNPQQDGHENIYTYDMVWLDGAGELILGAQMLPTVNSPYPQYLYKSGCVTSQPSFNQAFGWFEARMRLPGGPTQFPAFWAFPKEWIPSSPTFPRLQQEFDMMECYESDSNIKATTFYPPYQQVSPEVPGADVTAWHTYALEWTPTMTRFWVDDRIVLTALASEGAMIPSEPMFPIANIAMKQRDRPEPRPEYVEVGVDWIRVWQAPGLTPGPV